MAVGDSVTLVLDAGHALCENVQRQGLSEHLFSDITVSFLGKDYKLHRIILSQSSYFRSLLSGPWKESGKPRVELQIDDHNVTAEGLEIAFSFMYGVNPSFTGETAVGSLAAGCFLCMENLCERCVQFMIQDLKVETFVTYQLLSERHCYGQFAERIRDACWTFLCTHGARELTHVLPKLSLQVLCRLLKSDELWVKNEVERYNLAKNSLVEWKLARMRTHGSHDSSSAKKLKGMKTGSARKSTRSTAAVTCNKLKEFQKLTRQSPREKSNNKKKEICLDGGDKVQQGDDFPETAFRKLQRLWREDCGDSSEGVKESYNMILDLFTGGGIIFAHMDENDALQARKDFEGANMSTEVVNDGIWQNVLLKSRVMRQEQPNDDEDDEDDSEDEEDEEEDDLEDEDPESSEYEEDDSSDEEEDIPVASSVATNTSSNTSTSKRLSRVLIGYSNLDMDEVGLDGKRRKTTGGFTWAAKLDIGMQLSDFPPFRFGCEFVYSDKQWLVPDRRTARSADVFYGGSNWQIGAEIKSKEEWWFGVTCRCIESWQSADDKRPYTDQRKKVTYSAKVYVKTKSGLQCVTGNGQKKRMEESNKNDVGMKLGLKDISKDNPVRVSAVIQLTD